MEMADPDTWVHLAPEANLDDPDVIALDVYGLGAISYLLLTCAAPANSIPELAERIRGSKGPDPAVEIDGMTDGFRQLVMRATHPDARLERTASATDFLHDLDTSIEQWTGDSQPGVVVDPLETDKMDVLTDDLIVEARLGSGSTGVALPVTDLETQSVHRPGDDLVPVLGSVARYRRRASRRTSEGRRCSAAAGHQVEC